MKAIVLSLTLLSLGTAQAQELNAPDGNEAPAELAPVAPKPESADPLNPAAARKPTAVQDSDPFFREVARDLRCPTCTGLSILESDAGFSIQIKDQVKEQMQLGKSKEEIKEYFVERYGPWILREPPKEGFNLLAWVVPIVLLCLGPIAIWLLVWKRRVHVNTQGVRSNDALIAEMQERLKAIKQEKVG
ncbi:MAG: cytochrome c-type biogenesis protein [Oligoflexus sp.]|jgi:cytochrome c-type biogenesis protein CcmH